MKTTAWTSAIAGASKTLEKQVSDGTSTLVGRELTAENLATAETPGTSKAVKTISGSTAVLWHQMEAPVAKRMSAKVVMPAIPGTPAATAGTQRRPTAVITSAIADSTATSETIRNIMESNSRRDAGNSRDVSISSYTSNSSVASNFSTQEASKVVFIKI